MKTARLFRILLMITILVATPAAMVFAAPASDEADIITGTVQSITLATNPSTGDTTVLVTLLDKKGHSQNVRIHQKTAVQLGVVLLDESGNLFNNKEALGAEIDIPSSDVLPEEEVVQHPVGSALATFFADIPNLDYETIMAAHEDGNGFGVIAQALWLTRILEGDAEDLVAILEAKKTGDYSAFVMAEDGTVPTNWGQFRKAVLDGEQSGNLGIVMSGNDKDKDKDKEKDKDKDKDKDKEKDKDKDKDKDKGNSGQNGTGGSNGNGNSNAGGNANNNGNGNNNGNAAGTDDSLNNGNSSNNGNGDSKEKEKEKVKSE